MRRARGETRPLPLPPVDAGASRVRGGAGPSRRHPQAGCGRGQAGGQAGGRAVPRGVRRLPARGVRRVPGRGR
eukprot:5215611-Pyramimonas_sp.AAC.1